jgi:O-acetyl-ADP-ribose deacetylase (regulator of RNase III)/CHAT domain-containing protein
MQRTYTIGGRALEVFFGDVTDLPVDAIVNSENSDLRMDQPTGLSVSAAIRRIEGEEFAASTAKLGPLRLGAAVSLPTTRLRARHVIHAATVTRLSEGVFETSAEAIGKAVRSALAVAKGLGLRSVAFPAFGVRAAKLPREVASEVMVEAVFEHLAGDTTLERVVLALLQPETFLAFFERAILRARAADAPLVLHLERRDDDVLARFEDQGPLAALQRAGASARDLDLASERLDRLARPAERANAAAARAELRAAGGLVYSFLLPLAVRERLAAASARTLVIRTDEALAAIPWELAWDGETFLAERFSVSRGLVAEAPAAAPGARRAAARPAGPARVLILAAPTGDLPGAMREGEALLELMFATKSVKAELLGGERATRARVLERLASADALHFAGHARKTAAGLAWPLGSGDALTPRDVAHSRLRLVFANACSPLSEEGARRADARPTDATSERLGLGRAFLLAGVEGFLGSLFELEDGPASAFATSLWAELLRGETTGEALRRARARGRAQDSIDWAAYVHYGDPLARPFPGP